MLYTVDEVSERLGVPRPTLYRYLKEYAVPYERRAGRISIPEGSLDRIRRVRELHDEGLGTSAVRKRLQEGDGSEIREISDRLDRLSEEIERSRPGDPMSSSQALNVVLARQTVLISAVYDLTRMVEQLLESNGRSRPVPPGTATRREIVGPDPSPRSDLEPLDSRFGRLARRRRLATGLVAFLVAIVALVWAALAFGVGL